MDLIWNISFIFITFFRTALLFYFDRFVLTFIFVKLVWFLNRQTSFAQVTQENIRVQVKLLYLQEGIAASDEYIHHLMGSKVMLSRQVIDDPIVQIKISWYTPARMRWQAHMRKYVIVGTHIDQIFSCNAHADADGVRSPFHITNNTILKPCLTLRSIIMSYPPMQARHIHSMQLMYQASAVK